MRFFNTSHENSLWGLKGRRMNRSGSFSHGEKIVGPAFLLEVKSAPSTCFICPLCPSDVVLPGPSRKLRSPIGSSQHALQPYRNPLGSSWDPVSLVKPTSIQASLPPLPQPSTPIPSSAEPPSISQTGSCVPSNTSCDRAHATPIHPLQAGLPLHLYHPQVSRQSHVNVARPGLPPSPALTTGHVLPLPRAPRARERSC